MHPIIVAVDFSNTSIHALEYAIVLANRFKSDIILIWVDKLDSAEAIYPDSSNNVRNEAKKRFDELIEQYGKLLEKVLNATKKDAPALYKRLLTDRNEKWVPKLQELLAGDKNVIVIVGAGHLVGKQGVVELLRKKGVKIVQQ